MSNTIPPFSPPPSSDFSVLPPHLRPPEAVPTAEAVAEKIARQKATARPIDDRPAWVQLLETLQSRYDVHLLPHLEELRGRLAWFAASLLLASVGGWFACPWVFRHLQGVAPKGLQLVQLAPLDGVMLSLKLTLLLALVGSLPVGLWHLTRFINPGLKPAERAWFLGGLGFGLMLFLVGCVFAYLILLPTSLAVLWELSPVIATNQWNVVAYFNFCLFLTVGMGAVFQLPLLMGILGKVGVLSSALLLTYWRESLVGLLLIAALITPTQDPFTMVLVGFVLFVLYGASVGLLRWMGR
jgi:sec-independent protein translocase protein TatC